MRLRRILLWAASCRRPSPVVFALHGAWLGLDCGAPSTCRGSIANGSLESGRRLLYSGENYRAYSLLGYLAGAPSCTTMVPTPCATPCRSRQVEPRIALPLRRDKLAWGGNFAQHKTHANWHFGRFPRADADGRRRSRAPQIALTSSASMEFDGAGRAGSLLIDFEAMGLHLLALETRQRAPTAPASSWVHPRPSRSTQSLPPAPPAPRPLARLPFQRHALLGAAWRALPRRFRRALPVGRPRSLRASQWAGMGVHNALRRRDNR